MVCGPKVTAHEAGGEGRLLATLDHPRRVLALLQAQDNALLTGSEDGSIRVRRGGLFYSCSAGRLFC